MVKTCLFLVFLFVGFFTQNAVGQQADTAVSQQNSAIEEGDSVAFGEALVVLAWETYPENDAYRLEVLREKESVTQAKWDWMNDLGASFNINEGNINSEATSQFFPRYNFRISISLGTVVLTPSKIRQAKLRTGIAEENVDQQRLAVRREVLSRYYTYLFNINLLKIRLQSYEDVNSSYTSATQSFRRGEISLDQYNQALIARDRVLEARLEAERGVLLSRLSLEELIGMPLEQARVVIRNQRN